MPEIMQTWQSQSSYSGQLPGYQLPVASNHQEDFIDTGASLLSAIEESESLRNYDRWQQLIDNVLIEMGVNPQAFADPDEGVAAPTPDSIRAAVLFARFAREMRFPPGQTMLDGDGGIIMQHALPNGETESFEAKADGSYSIWYYPRAPQKPIQTKFELREVE